MSARDRYVGPPPGNRTRSRAVAIAGWTKRDYAAVAGQVVMLQAVTGYDSADNNVDRPLDPPVAFLVSTKVPGSELSRVVDDWIDPIWDVEPVEPKDPQIADLKSFYCYGPSYHLYENKEEPSDLAPVHSP